MRRVRCEEEKIYGKYLKDVRIYRGAFQEELSKGICSANLLSKVEQGKRYPDKLERDRFLERLGENGYDFECYLEDEEYEEWLKRRKIIALLHKGRLAEAGACINELGKEKRIRSKLKQQFLLTMKAQWMELQGVPREKIGPIVEDAVKQTAAHVDVGDMDDVWLSVQELNLILEYITYKKQDNLERHYLELLKYMEREYFDVASKAKMCPKIALYYAELVKSKREMYTEAEWQQKVRAVIEVCSFGLECLRNHEKAYYAVELLQIYEWFIDICYEMDLPEEERRKLLKEKEQAKEFIAMLQTLYKAFDVPEQTLGYLCFYMEYELHSYSDVVRARRKMFGYSKEDMEDVISIRTLERLEAKQLNSQRGTVQAVFKKLGLSTALHRAQIVTDKREAIWLEKKYRQLSNQKEFEKAEEILQQLKELIPMKFRINQQYIFYKECYLSYEQQKLPKEEFLIQAIKCLEFSLPLEAAMKEIKDVKLRNGCIKFGEKYLTNTEATILMHMAIATGINEKNKYYDVLWEYYKWIERQEFPLEQLGMYGFVMSDVADYMGSLGEYRNSNKISRKIVKESLYLRSLDYVERNLYSMMWNKKEQQGFDKQNPEWRRCLKLCIVINLYNKDVFHAEWMRKKLG